MRVAMLSLALLGAVGVPALRCGGSRDSTSAEVVPPRITPAWVAAHLGGCGDPCPEIEARQDRLWRRVKHRPDLREALEAVALDPSRGWWARGQAVTRLGATGQARAYETLARMYDDPALEPELRREVIFGLASGSEEPSDVAFASLARALGSPRLADREAAADALGWMAHRQLRSERARRLLEARLSEEADTAVAARLRRNIERGPW